MSDRKPDAEPDNSLISEEDFFRAIKCEMVDTLDEAGNQIPKLKGLKFKPIGVAESITVSNLIAKHGRDYASTIMFAVALRRPDGSRVISDERAPELMDSMAGIIGAASPVIASISGRPTLIDDEDGAEKKTSSANGPT